MIFHKMNGCNRWLTAIALTFCAATAHAANDYIVAPSGGDITGAALSAQLANGNVTLQSSQGKNAGSGNVIINDIVTWRANTTLTLTASNSVVINANISAIGNTAGLIINPNTANGKETPSGNGSYNLQAPAIILSGTTPSLTIAGVSYTVINSLGSATDATTAPATPTLQGIAATANLSGNFALGSDIDTSATSGWNNGRGFTPIGNLNNPFLGTFEGLGHTISNFTINLPATYGGQSDYVGLFGVLGNGMFSKGILRNIGVSGGSISGNLFIGSLVGQNNGTVSNSFAAVNVTGGGYDIGGLVGQNMSNISNSYAMGNVTGALSNSFNVGGLVGESYGPINNSYATGNVNGPGNNVGGLVGSAADYTSIANSYATGNVQGSNDVGGLVGEMHTSNKYSAATITQSYANGNVTGTYANVGGLVGIMFTDNSSGGNTITGSYSVGNVSGSDRSIGGLVGYSEPGSQVNSSYWNTTTSGQNGSAGGTKLTSDQMKTASSFSWNFTTTPGGSGWVIVDADNSLNNAGGAAGMTYPMLASEYSTTIRNLHQFLLMVMSPAARYSFDADPSAKMQSVSCYAGLNMSFTTTPGAPGWVIIDVDGTLNNANDAPGATYPMRASEYSTTITNARQLQLMAMAPSATYTLGNDIDASATGNGTDIWSSGGFAPISTFTGIFDGQGHTIRNLTINRPAANNVGLFGNTGNGTVIRNVGLAGGSVSGNNNVGGLVGYLNSSTVSKSYATCSVNGNSNVGGLVGLNYGTNSTNATVNSSYATGRVNGGSNVGGLVGQNQANGGSAIVRNSYSTGSVSGTGQVGGLVGVNTSGATSGGYWNTETSGQSLSAGGEQGLISSQMRTAVSFQGFSFSTTPGTAGWVIVDDDGTLNNANGVEGATYPMLASEYSTAIGNAHQLQLMAMNPAVAYTLNGNLDASGTAGGDVWSSGGFAPVGGYSVPFTGSFNGQEYTISDLNINRHKLNRVGLFGVIGTGSIIQNTVVAGGNVNGYGSVGGLAGINNGTVTNCTTSDNVKSYRGGFVGGMIGSNNGTISNSQASGNVSGTGGFRGGLAGVNNGTISSCSSTGTVSGEGGFTGQLIGINNSGGPGNSL